MNKAYLLLYDGGYGDTMTLGVFSTKELAQKAVDTIKLPEHILPAEIEILEFSIDGPLADTGDDKYFHVSFWCGSVHAVEGSRWDAAGSRDDTVDRVLVLAKDEDDAIAKAKEVRQKIIDNSWRTDV